MSNDIEQFFTIKASLLTQQLRVCAKTLNEEAHSGIKRVLSNKLAHCAPEDIDIGVQNAKNRVSRRIDKICDKFELHVKQDVFDVPAVCVKKNKQETATYVQPIKKIKIKAQPNEQHYRLPNEKLNELDEERKNLEKQYMEKLKHLQYMKRKNQMLRAMYDANHKNVVLCGNLKKQSLKTTEMNDTLSRFESNLQDKENNIHHALKQIAQMGVAVPNRDIATLKASQPHKVDAWRNDHIGMSIFSLPPRSLPITFAILFYFCCLTELLQNVESLEQLQNQQNEISHCFP
ncbi:hypothetical protein RFI_11395 [Reticulomyxa filosa]|uniref:Uncharacterized protein n=1 Tax=Reticulomyxa filosa TaxID=46433 RepID=X6NHD7_RETFI|nr:hypothetical protein RFI_11395 [Reticulomyxa filosa]|eukprot:ETO25740.1 hypothetical protein RFI_11395 [Reticulomyxa filosa]